MDMVTARARPSRELGQEVISYYCGGDGCRRRIRLAIFYDIPPSPSISELYGLFAAENFAEADGIYQLVPNSTRPRGRKVAWDLRRVTEDKSRDEEHRQRLMTRYALRREARRAKVTDISLVFDPRFRCPECGALNVVQAYG